MESCPASVLAIDIVSYSTALDETQNRYLNTLNTIVGDVLNEDHDCSCATLPTGDGVILVFPGKMADYALKKALRIHQRIQDGLLKLPVRIGIHDGGVIPVSDLTGKTNYVGNTMNICQRVMDAGDEGHILLSESAFNSVNHMEVYTGKLYALRRNPIEVKHKVSLNIYNYYDGRFGNPNEPCAARGDVGLLSCAVGRSVRWEDLINGKTKLKIIGNSLPLFGVPQLHDRIVTLSRDHKTRIKICLLNPISMACALRGKADAYKSEDELIGTIDYVMNRLIELHKAVACAERFEIRVFDSIPTFTAFIGDNHAHVSFYVEHLSGTRGPYIACAREHSQNCLYDCIEGSFDNIWEKMSISIFDPGFADYQTAILSAWKEGPRVRALAISDLVAKLCHG